MLRGGPMIPASTRVHEVVFDFPGMKRPASLVGAARYAASPRPTIALDESASDDGKGMMRALLPMASVVLAEGNAEGAQGLSAACCVGASAASGWCAAGLAQTAITLRA